MRHFLILMMVVLVVLLAGCKTTGTSGGVTSNLNSAHANWDGYNADGRLRIDVLVVKYDDKVGELVRDAREKWEFSKLPFKVFDLVQSGGVERADGFQQVLVEFTNPNTSISGPFFSYGYGDTNNPEKPIKVNKISASGNPGWFLITAHDGYASIDLPYEFIKKATFVEISTPQISVFFPYNRSTVMNESSELYELVQNDKQFYLMLVVLAPD